MEPSKKPRGRRAILWEKPPAGVQGTYEFIAKQMDVARPRDIAILYMLRSNDPKQQEAMQLMQEAKTALWTRRAVIAVVLSVPLNGLITFLVTR
jgi:hypothetical protein